MEQGIRRGETALGGTDQIGETEFGGIWLQNAQEYKYKIIEVSYGTVYYQRRQSTGG